MQNKHVQLNINQGLAKLPYFVAGLLDMFYFFDKFDSNIFQIGTLFLIGFKTILQREITSIALITEQSSLNQVVKEQCVNKHTW